jgi:hypothetical protein
LQCTTGLAKGKVHWISKIDPENRGRINEPLPAPIYEDPPGQTVLQGTHNILVVESIAHINVPILMKSGEIDSDARPVPRVIRSQDVKEFSMFVRDSSPEKAG